jgi:ABC-2 type transport system ATP-binding protein
VSSVSIPAWRGEACSSGCALQPQRAALFPELTVAETLALWASLYAEPASEEAVIEDVALTDRRHVRAGTLSGGQQQRLLLGMTLIADPELLILDEPTAGLDPTARRALWDTVRRQREAGRTVVLNSHDMDEVTHLCDRVVIIDRGRVIDGGTPAELVRRHFPRRTVEFSTKDEIDLDMVLSGALCGRSRGRPRRRVRACALPHQRPRYGAAGASSYGRARRRP